MFLIYTSVFLIGLAFGSFASVVIHRLHTKEPGILTGRSKCPKCENKLKAIDLIPLISYVINKFKCRYCKHQISLLYPILELVMGVMFFLTVALVGLESIPDLIFYLYITFVFVVLTFYDILFKEVPDEVSLPAFVISFIYLAVTKAFGITDLLIGITIPILFFGTLFFASKGRWLGGGDIRIGALMGALLAWPNILIGLFLGYFLGAIFSLFGLATGTLGRKSQIPFAPFLLIGTYVAMFWAGKL